MAVTAAEIRRGVELLGPGRRRAALEMWADEVIPGRFAGLDLQLLKPRRPPTQP